MSEVNHRDEIVRLEAKIDELAVKVESRHKFILADRIAVAGGSMVLLAMLLAVTAVLGGIVAAGSNSSTAKEATHELRAAEARRTTLIAQIDLRPVSNRDH